MENPQKEPVKVRRDIYFGDGGMRRLFRLIEMTGHEAGDVVRSALIEYELNQTALRDVVRDAVLDLARSILPDGRDDPTQDTRREQAERSLAELLNSLYAAQGIAQALVILNTTAEYSVNHGEGVNSKEDAPAECDPLPESSQG